MLYSPRYDTWKQAIALLDTGSDPNWIHPKLVSKCGFITSTLSNVNGAKYCSINGEVYVLSGQVQISFQGLKARKPLEAWFYVLPENSALDVILGWDFIKKENLLSENPGTHAFSRRSFENSVFLA